MPWIENVAAADIPTGFHHDAGPNSMLISIVDPASWRPEAKHEFKERHNFEFLDVEETDEVLEESMKCSHKQAAELVRLLQHALENHMNVVVHCFAGICRSGAVCEVGVMMGFNDTERFRSPNLLVKHRMMKHLGWTYDEREPHSINGVPVPEDWTNNNEKVFTLAAARRERRLKEGDI
jgi:rhodanese-related sulfurtransferase